MKRNQKRGTEKQREYKEGEGTSKSNVITASEMTSKESFVINVEQNEKQVPQSLSQSSLEHHTHNTNHESTQIKIETNVNDKSSSVPPPPHQ
jgi:predicted RNA-binding protein with PUA domain